jgi:hypothetical protein
MGPKQIDQVCFTAETAALLADDQKKLKEQQLRCRNWNWNCSPASRNWTAARPICRRSKHTLQDRWTQLQDASNDDMDHLARMYGTMKPDQAASIFNQMDSDFAAGFLRLMRSEQAGMILAGMETKKAYEVSLRLAADERRRPELLQKRIDSIVCSFQDRLILMCPVMIVLAI